MYSLIIYKFLLFPDLLIKCDNSNGDWLILKAGFLFPALAMEKSQPVMNAAIA